MCSLTTHTQHVATATVDTQAYDNVTQYVYKQCVCPGCLCKYSAYDTNNSTVSETSDRTVLNITYYAPCADLSWILHVYLIISVIHVWSLGNEIYN
jgi:uncharacterized protein (DUF2225 family)